MQNPPMGGKMSFLEKVDDTGENIRVRLPCINAYR